MRIHFLLVLAHILETMSYTSINRNALLNCCNILSIRLVPCIYSRW